MTGTAILAILPTHVNSPMNLLVILLGCALHVGRPPSDGITYSVLRVDAPVVEPGVADDLRAATAGALAGRGALGAGGRGVEITVLRASSQVLAAEGARRVYQAELSARWLVLGPKPHQVVLSGQRSYIVVDLAPEGPGAASVARAAAFQALAGELSEDAVAWMISGGVQ